MSRHRNRSPLRVLAAARIGVRWVFAADRVGATGNAIGQVVSAVASIGLVVLSKILLEHVLKPTGESAFVALWPLFALAVVSGVVTVMQVVAGQQERLTGERVQQAIWHRLLDAIGRVDLVTYESDGFTTRLARVEQNAVARPLPTVRAVFAMIGASLGVLAMAVVLFTLQPLLPPLLVVAAVPAILLSRRGSRSEFAFAGAVTPDYMRREYLRTVLSRRQYAAELRAFEAGALLRPRHQALNTDFVARLRTQVRYRQRLAAAGASASAVSLVLVLVVIAALVDAHRMTFAQAGAAAIAARLLGAGLTRLYTSFGTLSEAAPHILDLQDFLSEDAPVRPPGRRLPLRNRIELRGVGFVYPTRSDAAVTSVDLVIGAGEVVALVGENGSGKSTLARIVAGLFDAGTGEVCWDGQDSVAVDRIASTSLLTQDFGRYAFSVADNIAIADSTRSADAAALQAAAVAARFDGVVAELPDGYATMLGREVDDGVDLSGGQWQRLALARALFRGGDLMVLDEPSAALDPRAESELFDDVRRVLAGRSALLISHRYASVRLADRIYVLHAGRVVEHGTHDQLMAADGRYAELFRLQSSAFLSGLSGAERSG